MSKAVNHVTCLSSPQSGDAGEAATQDPADNQTTAEGALPEIQPGQCQALCWCGLQYTVCPLPHTHTNLAKEHSATLEAPVLSSDQPPPDLLMASDETTPTPSSAQEDTATTATVRLPVSLLPPPASTACPLQATAEETEEAMESGSTAEGCVATGGVAGGPGCPVVDEAGDGVAEDREAGVGETRDEKTGDGEAEDEQQETDLEQRRERQRERALSSGQGQEESSRPRSPP